MAAAEEEMVTVGVFIAGVAGAVASDSNGNAVAGGIAVAGCENALEVRLPRGNTEWPSFIYYFTVYNTTGINARSKPDYQSTV